MTNSASMVILERVNEIERNLQKLKVDLLFGSLQKKGETGIYKTENILKEIKKIRKQFWDEKYSKGI